MKFRTSIAFRIGAVFSVLIVLLLGGLMSLLAVRVSSETAAYSRAQNFQMAESRALYFGEVIEKISWELKALAMSDALRSGDPRRYEPFVRSLEGKLSSEAAGAFFADAKGDDYTSLGLRSNLADRDYFSEIMNGSDFVVSSTVQSKSLGVPIVVFASAVKDEADRTIGLVALQVKLSTLSEEVAKLKTGKSGFVWIASRDGAIIAHPTQDLAGTALSSMGEKGYSGLDELSRLISDEEHGAAEYRGPQGRAIAAYFVSVPNSPGWRACLSIPRDEEEETFLILRKVFAIIVACGVLVSVLVSIAIGRLIARPIKRTADEFKSLSTGEADLTRRIEVSSSDEVGALCEGFNDFVAELANTVAMLKAAQAELGGIGVRLGSSVDLSAKAIGGMGESIASVEAKAGIQIQAVAETSCAVEQISRSIEGLGQVIGEQASSVSEASASIEEMIGSIRSIVSSMERMAGEFGSLAQAAEEGKATEAAMETQIRDISDRSRTLAEANEVISTIASQTNLLAMNAAIEAAHAGEAGKGFSVVADEIRRLAETSAEQSRTIGEGLEEVLSAIDGIVASSKDSLASFEGVAEKIASTDALVNEVRSAIDEEGAGSSQILEALKEMNDLTSRVRGEAGEMSKGNDLILAAIRKLQAAAKEIGSASVELSAELKSIEQSSSGVSEAADATRATIAKMEDAIGHFRV